MKLAAWVGLMTLVLGLVGCASRPTGPMEVPLVFKPTDPLKVGAATGAISKTVTIVVDDQRDKKNQVGVNTEKDTPLQILSPSDPGEFVREGLSRNLSASGVRVVPNGERVVRLTLTRFWVDESSTYNGTISATVHVTPAAGGQALWDGQVTGTNTRFGRSLNVSNYQECFSDCVMQLSGNLLADEGFRAALK